MAGLTLDDLDYYDECDNFNDKGEQVTKLTINDLADFTWDFGHQFFLETAKGNYVWSDPDYQGDNTITPYAGTLEDWLKENGGYGRCKEAHYIRNYCGSDVVIKE